jgi:hypothetical protein
VGKRQRQREKQDPPPLPKCMFCGKEGKRTYEDGWPNWLLAMFETLPGNTATEYRTINGRRVNVRENVKGRPSKRRRRIVCGPCNEGWMSNLEEAAKPILVPLILGEQRPLSESDQRVLATWAIKTGMTLNEMTKETTILAPLAVRRHLAESSSPPPGYSVYMAVPNDLARELTHRHLGFADLENGTLGEPYGIAHLLVVGRIAFQVIGEFLDNRPLAPIDGDVFQRIWPEPTPVSWPRQDWPQWARSSATAADLLTSDA